MLLLYALRFSDFPIRGRFFSFQEENKDLFSSKSTIENHKASVNHVDMSHYAKIGTIEAEVCFLFGMLLNHSFLRWVDAMAGGILVTTTLF